MMEGSTGRLIRYLGLCEEGSITVRDMEWIGREDMYLQHCKSVEDDKVPVNLEIYFLSLEEAI